MPRAGRQAAALRLDLSGGARLIYARSTQHPYCFGALLMADREINQLIERAEAGDQGAYTDLMTRFQPQIQAVCLKMVRNEETARDLTQETFIKAFGALHTFDPAYTFSTWLYKIARNACIDHFRKAKIETYSLDAPIRTREGVMEREMEEAMRERYGKLVFKNRINKRVKIEASPAFQQPITSYDPKGPSAKEFRKVADEMMKRLKKSTN